MNAPAIIRQTPQRLAPCLVLALLAGTVHAQTWTGLGGNGDWNNPANWNPAIVPVGGASVTFVGPANNVVDLNGSRIVSILTFDSTIPFTLLNDTLILSGLTSTNSISGDHQIFSNVTTAGLSNFEWNIGADAPVAVIGDIGGGGGIRKQGAGILTLTGANGYLGGTVFEQGIVSVEDDANLGTTTGSLTFDGGDLRWDAAFDLDPGRAITLNAGGGTLRTRTFSTTIAQAITGTGGLTKAGSGTLTLDGVNTYSGDTNLDNGVVTLGVVDALKTSTVSINDDDGLDINGLDAQIGGLAGSGDLALGVQTLEVGFNNANTSYSGVITGGAGSRIQKLGSGTLALTGGTSGSPMSFDSLRADAGVVVLDGANIDLNSDQTYISGPLTTFGGDIVIQNGSEVRVTDAGSYTSIENGSLTITGSGTLLQLNKSIRVSDVETQPGSILVDDQATLTLTDNLIIGDDDAGDLTVQNGGSVSAAHAVFGRDDTGTSNSLITGLGSSLTAAELGLGGQNANNTQNIGGTGALTVSDSAGVVVTGPTTFWTSTSSLSVDGGTYTTDTLAEHTGVSGTVSLSDPIGNVALTVGTGDGDSTFNGLIQDAGGGPGSITKVGTGTLTLNGANTFTGTTTVIDGTLELGTGGATGSVGGDIVNNSALIVNRTGSFSNAVSGTGTVDYVAPGTTTIGGANDNTYSGLTTFSGGVLRLNKTGGAIAIPDDFTITSGTVDVLRNNQIANAATVTTDGDFNMDGVSDLVRDFTAGNGAAVSLTNGATLDVLSLSVNGAGTSVSVTDSTLTVRLENAILTDSEVSLDGSGFSMGGSRNLRLNGATALFEAVNGSSLNMNGNGAAASASDLTVNDGVFTLSADSSYTATASVISGGDINLNGGTADFAGTVSVRGQNATNTGDGPRSGDLTVDGAAATIANTWNGRGGNGDGLFSFSADGGRGGRLTVADGSLTLEGSANLDLRGGNGDNGGPKGATGRINANGGTLILNQAVVRGDATPTSADPIVFYEADLRINGGDVFANNAMTVEGAQAEIELLAGSLTATTITELAGGDMLFTGGTLTVENFVGDLAQDGGTLSPGASPGITTITGNYDLNAGTLAIELAGAGGVAGTDFDLLDVTGDLTLAGTLDVSLFGGYTPAIGDNFFFLNHGGSRSGMFDNLLLPSSPGVGLRIEYVPNIVRLIADLAGDLNGDGFVGIDDLNIVLGAWNQNVTAGIWSQGDPSGDGFIGIDDLNTVLGNWNAGTPPPPGVANIPEPASLSLLILGGLFGLKRPRMID